MTRILPSKVGRWNILSPAVVRRKKGYCYYFHFCRCDCGTEKWVSRTHLLSEKTRSCGCYKKEANRIWKSLTSKKNENIAREEWERIRSDSEWSDFVSFYRDTQPQRTRRHHLHKINEDLPYSKENFRWVKSKDKIIEFNGKRLVLKDWMKEPEAKGLSLSLLHKRYDRGDPPAEIFRPNGKIHSD
jgi:hypothetical protein